MEVLARDSTMGVLEPKGGASHQFPPIKYNPPDQHGEPRHRQTPMKSSRT